MTSYDQSLIRMEMPCTCHTSNSIRRPHRPLKYVKLIARTGDKNLVESTYFCKKCEPLVHLVWDPNDYEYVPITADEYMVLRVMSD